MKNKLFYLFAFISVVAVLSSCASRKYGCPNSAGIKVESKAVNNNA